MSISPVSALQAASIIVSPTPGAGNYIDIPSAMTAASAGTTVLVKDGTYVGNITGKAGVTLAAYNYDNVTIVGKYTASFSGQANFQGITFQTNSDYIAETTASGSSLIFDDCNFSATNNTAFSNAGAMAFYNCNANTATTGIAFFVGTAGGITVSGGVWANGGGSTTASSLANCNLEIYSGCYFQNNLSFTGTGVFSGTSSTLLSDSVTFLTTAGTGGGEILNCNVECGSGACVSVGAGTVVTVAGCSIQSNATYVFTGAGTINEGGNTFYGVGSSSGNNVTTQVYYPLTVTQGGTGQSSYGLSGQILTSNGPGVPPTFQAAGGGTPTSFYAYCSTVKTNVTGNSVTYDVIFDSTTSNVGSAFNTSTGLFTAPTTQMYSFAGTIFLTAGSVFNGTTILLGFIGSAISQRLYQVSPTTPANSSSIALPFAFQIPMTAGDTVGIQVFSDTTTQTISVYGAATSAGSFNANSSFSGFGIG